MPGANDDSKVARRTPAANETTVAVGSMSATDLGEDCGDVLRLDDDEHDRGTGDSRFEVSDLDTMGRPEVLGTVVALLSDNDLGRRLTGREHCCQEGLAHDPSTEDCETAHTRVGHALTLVRCAFASIRSSPRWSRWRSSAHCCLRRVETYTVLRAVSMGSIGLLFFLYGVRLSTAETITGLTNWRLHAAILASTFVIFPALGLAVRGLIEPIVGVGLAAGFVLLCLIPTTVQSNVVFTRMAGGDTAAAVVAASLSNLIGVFATPALVAWLLAANAEVNASSFVRIVVQFLLPFVLGQLVRPWLGAWVARNDGWLKHVDRSSILLVVFLAFSVGATSGVWSRVSVWSVSATIALCLVLLAAACGWLVAIGRALGLSRPARIALLFCGSNKSLATGLPMAYVLFPAHTVALIVLPLMIYHQLQIISGGAIVGRLNRRQAA